MTRGSLIALLLRVCLSVAYLAATATAAQDDAIQSGKKPEKEIAVSETSSLPENWTLLQDIKTGLQPRPPVEVQRDEIEGFTRELVRLEWRAGDPIDLWVTRPETSARVPVILYLYSYPADTDRFRDNGWSKRATENGFAAVGFVSALTGHRYAYRPMKEWFISELQESLGSSVHDVQLILNYLAARGDMDMGHVGMFGMGSGGAIAILAAQADPRIAALDILDPWGDWPDWLRESPAIPETERPKYTTQEFLKSVADLDPTVYLPQIRTRSLRVEQILSDPVTPEKAKNRIAASLRDSSVLVRYVNAQEHMKAWQANGLSGWIKQELRAGAQAQGDDKAK